MNYFDKEKREESVNYFDNTLNDTDLLEHLSSPTHLPTPAMDTVVATAAQQ